MWLLPFLLLQSAFQSQEAYYKAIGFKEDEGKIENVDNYLTRLESYMKLYGALVQTEISRVQNAHGLKECWAWLARFLNALPATRYTAVALKAFLYTAGYSLLRKYKSQFRKMLNIISENFLENLLKNCLAVIQVVSQALCIGSYEKCKETGNFDEGSIICRNILRILNRTPIRFPD